MVKRRHRSLAGVALLLVSLSVATHGAEPVTFEATLEPARVPPGRPAVLEVTLSAETSDLPEVALPSLDGADVSTGGTSQQFSMINGAVSVSKTWRWRIHPRGSGDVKIPALEVMIDGEVYRTEPLTLRVDAAGAPAPLGNGNRGAAPTPSAGDRPAPDMPGPGDDHFVTLEVDRTEAYVGEQVILTFRYYQALRARGFDRPEYTAPRTEGFWREELGEPEIRRLTRGGVAYQVTEIRYSLTPTRPGDLLVEPARVVVPRDPFSGFFGRRAAGPQELWTTSATVRVRDLPSPRPEGFSGLVSRDVSLSVVLDRDTIPQGEAVSATLRIRADGSLKSLTPPSWRLPDEVQVHEAGSRVGAEIRGGRLRGILTDERILQPLAPGDYHLPPVELVTFDPGRGEYVTQRTDSLTLVATPSDFVVAAEGRDRRRGDGRPAVELAFVHVVDGRPRRPAPPLPERPVWWSALGLPLLLLGAFRLVLARQDRDRRDPVGRRRRQALAAARARLDDALGRDDPAAALGEAAAAVRGYVADREGRPPAAVDAAAVVEHLRRRLDDDRAERARSLLDRCAGASFGRQEDAARDAATTIGELRSLIEAAARARAGRGGAALGALLLGFWLASATTSAAAADPVRLSAEGNQAYTAGDLDTAMARYREAAAVTDDADVHYNLGNAYARRGELGRAVASYRRALRRAPRDGDLRANLALVRSRAADRDLSAAAPGPAAALSGAVGRLTVDEWAALLAVLVWALAGGVAAAWWRGRTSPGLRRLLLGLTAAFLIVAAVTALRWYDERVVDHAVVVADREVLRSGPDATFPEVLTVSDGLELRIEARRGDWCQVGLGGDWRGWLPARALEPVRRTEGAGG